MNYQRPIDEEKLERIALGFDPKLLEPEIRTKDGAIINGHHRLVAYLRLMRRGKA